MSNSKSVSTTTFDQINANLNVGIDDVVNVFISKYEDGLIAQRTSKQLEVKQINNQINQVVEELDAEVERFKEQYEQTITIGTLKSEYSIKKNCTTLWESQKVICTVSILTTVAGQTDSYYCGSNSIVKVDMTIPNEIQSEYKQLLSSKTILLEQLQELNGLLRDVSRKERQVRGRIAEQKLENLGMTDLLNEPSLLKLVQVD